MISHLVNVARAALHEHGKARSPQWRAFELHHIGKTCAACGGTLRLQLHHIQPFHLHPELERDPANVITLCMGPRECHLELGHGGNFRRYNPSVVASAAAALASPALFADLVAGARLASRR